MIFGKLVAAALLVAAPLVSADFSYTAYSKTVACTAEEVRIPATPQEVSDIIKEAAWSFKKVRALAAKHSGKISLYHAIRVAFSAITRANPSVLASDIICTDGIAVSTEKFNKITISADKKTVTAGAGARLFQVMDALEKQGLMLQHFPAFGAITVGGAIATGAHGSTLKYPGTISDQVLSVTLVDGLGRIRTIKSTDDDINLARVHLGLLGIVTEVVLPVVPNYKVKLFTYPAPDSFLTSGAFRTELAKHDYFYMYWFPSTGSVTVSNATYVPVSTPGEDFWTIGGPTVGPATGAIQGLVKNLETVQQIKNQTIWCGIAQGNFAAQFQLLPNSPYFNPQFQPVNPATGFGRKIMNNYCVEGTCPWDLAESPLELVDISISIPIAQLPAASLAVKEVLKQYPACLAFNGIFLRFVRASNAVLSTAAGRDSVYFEIVTTRRSRPEVDARFEIDAISAIAQLLIKKFEGRPHWGKNGLAMFQSCFLYKNNPGMTKFALSVATSYDPFAVFANDWARRSFLGKELPRGKGCALEDNCFCRTDAECGVGLKCVKAADWNVCRSA
ncbi:hypothetical protein HDU96_003892 [Phlyctochytrium bullatum]|nr:hypothetical protein HDU96_003892 [Phlyctochytrium bullatum]